MQLGLGHLPKLHCGGGGPHLQQLLAAPETWLGLQQKTVRNQVQKMSPNYTFLSLNDTKMGLNYVELSPINVMDVQLGTQIGIHNTKRYT